MKTIDNEYFYQLEINKSKFLSFAYPVSDEAHAKEILNLKKLEFKDATHICFGLVLSSPRLEKCSDDGEPSGTAGKPILELIKKKDLENVLIVVVRYFGGKKLGAGGLIRAYTNSAKLVIDKANIVESFSKTKYVVTTQLNSLDKTKRLITSLGGEILNINFGERAEITFEIKSDCELPINLKEKCK